MYDPQHQLFVQRIKRVNRANRRGLGFEAVGTLGRSHYNTQERRRNYWRPALFAAVGFLGVKAIMLTNIGVADYEARVEAMSAGTAMNQFAAFVMQMDPATIWMADQLAIAFK